MRRVTLRQLRAFAIVARGHTHAHAAAELRLSPSAVSLQIKDLEAAAQQPLFDRTTKESQLTAAGELLLSESINILAALDRARSGLARLRSGGARRVAVGMVGNAQYFVPRLLAQFRLHRSDVELSLGVGNRARLLDQLRTGEVDLAIMGTPPDGFEGRADRFASQPLGIVAPRCHPLAGRRAIEPEELLPHDFIVRESGSGTRTAMERFFQGARIEPHRVMEIGNNESIKQAVVANMGLAFLSLQTAALELQLNLLVALDVVGLPLQRPWFVIANGRTAQAEAVSSLHNFILEAGESAVAPA